MLQRKQRIHRNPIPAATFDNSAGTILQDEPPPSVEHALFRQFDESIRERKAWASSDLLSVVDQIEMQLNGAGPKWVALKREIPRHNSWPTKRLVALAMRLQQGEDPKLAGDSELLHAG